MNYLMSLFDMVKSLKENDKIEVLEDEILSGHPEEYMREDMADLLADLPFLKEFDFSDIEEFYLQCNGCNIAWRSKNPEEDIEGAVRILSFEKVFMQIQQYFDEEIKSERGTEFKGMHYKDKTFGERLFLFDVYSEQTGFSLVFADPPQPKIMMLPDYYIVWDHSKITDFKSYFNFILACRGSFQSRFEHFAQHRGDLHEAIVFKEIPYGTNAEPSIFKD